MAQEWAKAFYNSRRWQDARRIKILEADGLCELCGNLGEEVHHKVKLTQDNINDPSITLGRDNLILLCFDCHKRMHRKHEDKQYMFDDGGDLIGDIPPLIN